MHQKKDACDKPHRYWSQTHPKIDGGIARLVIRYLDFTSNGNDARKNSTSQRKNCVVHFCASEDHRSGFRDPSAEWFLARRSAKRGLVCQSVCNIHTRSEKSASVVTVRFQNAMECFGICMMNIDLDQFLFPAMIGLRSRSNMECVTPVRYFLVCNENAREGGITKKPKCKVVGGYVFFSSEYRVNMDSYTL